MSFGFLALNNNNEVLISSDTKNLHFLQKMTSPTTVSFTSNDYGGMRRWIYSFSNVNTVPVPFFSVPTPDYYAISRVEDKGSNNWDVEIIRSGTSTSTPEVYLFAPPTAGSPSGNYGMVVFSADGSSSFDSRLKPLAITGGRSVSHPTNPRASYSSTGLLPRYCPTNAGSLFAPTEYSSYTLSGQPSKPIFSFFSLAQAERELIVQETEEECDGLGSYNGNCVGFSRTYYYTSKYWAFYRGGVRWNSGNLRAGWIVVEKGCNWTYDKYSDFLGIGTGGDSGTGGNWPYSNETINTTANSVIVANGASYD
jgi:hypothetical protein